MFHFFSYDVKKISVYVFNMFGNVSGNFKVANSVWRNGAAFTHHLSSFRGTSSAYFLQTSFLLRRFSHDVHLLSKDRQKSDLKSCIKKSENRCDHKIKIPVGEFSPSSFDLHQTETNNIIDVIGQAQSENRRTGLLYNDVLLNNVFRLLETSPLPSRPYR